MFIRCCSPSCSLHASEDASAHAFPNLLGRRHPFLRMTSTQTQPTKEQLATDCNSIEMSWSIALSASVRQTKYDAFMRIIPSSLDHLWVHHFGQSGEIKSTFSTTDDAQFIEMRQAIAHFTKNTTFACTECVVHPSRSVGELLSRDNSCDAPPSTIAQRGRKTQSVLANVKHRKPPRWLQDKWQKEKQDRAELRARNEREHNQRLARDEDFAQREAERIEADKLRKEARREEAKQKKRRDAEVQFLFGKIWGEEQWEELRQMHRAKVGPSCMPIGNYQFFSGSHVLEHKDMFHEQEWMGKGFPRIDGMPPKCDRHFRQWHRQLPIHPMFVDAQQKLKVHVGGPNDDIEPFRYLDQCDDSSDSSDGEDSE